MVQRKGNLPVKDSRSSEEERPGRSHSPSSHSAEGTGDSASELASPSRTGQGT